MQQNTSNYTYPPTGYGGQPGNRYNPQNISNIKSSLSSVLISPTYYQTNTQSFRSFLFRIFEVVLILVKASFTVNFLASAHLFRVGGYSIPIFLVLPFSIVIYSIHLILKSNDEICKRLNISRLNYATLTKYAILEGPPFFRILSKFMS